MAITIDEGVFTRMTNKNNSSIEITQKPESIISQTTNNDNYKNTNNDHQYYQSNIYHRSFSMTSLHYHGRPKKSRQEVIRSMSPILSEQIPLEIIVPAYTTNTTISRTSTTTTKAYNTTITSTAAATNNGDHKRTILNVVGVPENSSSRILKKYYSHSHFPYFQQHLTETIAQCRKQPNSDIIHIHSSSSLSRSYCSSSASTHKMSSLLSRSIQYNDNKSTHSSHNNNRSSLHAVTGGCASNSRASNASSSDQLVRYQKDELLITKPIWSPSGNILLMNALEQLSQRNIARNNDMDPDQTTTSTATPTVLVCGLVTSVCVLQTANACSEAGYTTSLIENACADRDRIRHDQAVSFVKDRTCSHPR